MKNPIHQIASSYQDTAGVEGCACDSADGSQVAFWTCRGTAESAEHVHDYDEYMIVVEGCYTLLIQGHRISLKSGQEYFIAV